MRRFGPAWLLLLMIEATAAPELRRAELPVWFEPNAGQADAEARFVARAAGQPALLSSRRVRFDAASLEFVGAADVEGEALEPSEGHVSYFTADFTRAGLPTFGRVRFAEVWPGIDLVFHGERGQLEYDFEVKPGADESVIRLRLDGATDRLTLGAPLAFEAERPVDARFVASGELLSFAVARRDRQAALLIDPVLVYSSYLGGSVSDYGTGGAVDQSGAFYFYGRTASTNFPTAGTPAQGMLGGASDAYVAKVNPAGSALVYCTYLGGSSIEVPTSLAIDSSGRAWAVGYTASSNYPLVAGTALQTMLRGGADAFITRLSANGTSLEFSTFFGGNNIDQANAVAVRDTRIFVGGETLSNNLFTASALQGASQGMQDGFVIQLTTADTLLFSTYVGGSGDDTVSALAVDSAGLVVVAGTTFSANLPALGTAYQLNYGGSSDGFLLKLGTDGSGVWRTYFGGTSVDEINAVSLDASGNVFITGYAGSGLPVMPAGLQMYGGGGDAFVAKLSSSGDALVYSTYFGGTGAEYGLGIEARTGIAFVTGHTTSNDMPTQLPVQTMYGGGPQDCFVLRLDAAGALTFATYLGGNGDDRGQAIAVDSSQHIYVSAISSSTNFPLAQPLQGALDGGGDGAFFKLQLDAGGTVVFDGGSTGDGGSMNDGGSTGDGGNAGDGGTTSDGGTTTGDGGNATDGGTTSDGGTTNSDGGSTTDDGGTPPDGGPTIVHEYRVGCGCGAADGSVLLLLLLALRQRRANRHA